MTRFALTGEGGAPLPFSIGDVYLERGRPLKDGVDLEKQNVAIAHLTHGDVVVRSERLSIPFVLDSIRLKFWTLHTSGTPALDPQVAPVAPPVAPTLSADQLSARVDVALLDLACAISDGFEPRIREKAAVLGDLSCELARRAAALDRPPIPRLVETIVHIGEVRSAVRLLAEASDLLADLLDADYEVPGGAHCTPCFFDDSSASSASTTCRRVISANATRTAMRISAAAAAAPSAVSRPSTQSTASTTR